MQRVRVQPGCQRVSATRRDQDMALGGVLPGQGNASKARLSEADCSEHLVQGKFLNYLKFSQEENNHLGSPGMSLNIRPGLPGPLCHLVSFSQGCLAWHLDTHWGQETTPSALPAFSMRKNQIPWVQITVLPLSTCAT